MSEDMDKAQRGEGEARRKPLAELTVEELHVLAAEAKAADEEVQALVRQVYKAALEERVMIRYHLWKLTARTPLLLLPRLLEFVAREARLEGLLVGRHIAGTIPAGKWD